MDNARTIIEQAWENRAQLNPASAPANVRAAIEHALAGLDAGRLRIAEKTPGGWVTHQWLKMAVLLSFRIDDNHVVDGRVDPLLRQGPGEVRRLGRKGVRRRRIPGSAAGDGPAGAHIARNVVLMPSYTNIGAYVGEGTMVDTWATVGSCAQIGKNVHLSGGVGIGGVLEPLQANPVIIEDNCFIGARSEVVEGVIVEENSVLSMGVYIGQSTKIFDRESGEVLYGRVPSGSVVVPGTMPSGDRSCALYCAVIVKKVDARTRAKTSLNELLRE
jgi:2,3,4,5-tetrahydropyridine-2-carboxylate N-succinyltransferase